MVLCCGSNRTFQTIKEKIKIGDSFSKAIILPFRVPQGSVVGRLFFTLYTSPLSQVISKFNVTHHLYADDTQIHLAVDSGNFDFSMEELTECLKSIYVWMNGVKLKLNPEKIEFIIKANSLVSRLQMLGSVVIWTSATLYFMG